jgi:hypothetical protein
LPGIYDLNVIKTGFGNAIATPSTTNDFAYEVSITNVSPSSGSIGGGTLITITGKNFVPDALDTLVTIGNELNQICSIEHITPTEIKCRTPSKNFYYAVNVPQVVTVDSKLIMPTNCSSPSSNCWFTFLPKENSPELLTISSNSITSGIITLNGLRFQLGSSIKVSFTNKITGKITVVNPNEHIDENNATVVEANSTQVNVTVPSVEAGLYGVRVRVDPLGETYPMTLTINPTITGVAAPSLSVNGGVVKIQGKGFPEKWPNQHYNRLALALGTTSLAL